MPPPPPTPAEEINKLKPTENEQNKQAYTIALATVEAAEAAIIAANAAAEVVHLTATAPKLPAMTREEISAVRIQTYFRGYIARRALRALKGLVRLNSTVHGTSVKRQSATTLRCMQTFARLQSDIRLRRIKMTEEKQSIQRQMQLKREKELFLDSGSSPVGDDWNTSLQSKEKIEANISNKQEAAMKRERALAYAYSHQWKASSSARSVNIMFADPNNPHWGWSWMERWMFADKDSTAPSRPLPRRQSPMTTATSTMRIKLRPTAAASPRIRRGDLTLTHHHPDDDARSILSVQSEWNKRHSIAGSSVRDDESLTSSPSVPSYMTPTESARAKTRMQNINNSSILDLNETTDTLASSVASGGYVKKRLSFPVTEKRTNTAVARRHSGPPTVNVA